MIQLSEFQKEGLGNISIITNIKKNTKVIPSIQLQKIINHKNPNRSFKPYRIYVDLQEHPYLHKILKESGIIDPRARRVNLIPANDVYKAICNLSIPNKEDVISWFKEIGIIENNTVLVKVRKEVDFINMLEGFLNSFDINIKKQFVIGKYRLDAYIPKRKICVEFDEKGHNQTIKEDNERDLYLLSKGIKTVRIKEDDCYGKALAEILKISTL
jgi:very-short-patch-repair endonuclease